MANPPPSVDIARAYQILGVRADATSHSIKEAYRKLLKRWHPDFYQPGTHGYDEASQMTRLVTEAYSLIAHAPLRYYREFRPPQTRSAQQRAASKSAPSPNPPPVSIPKLDPVRMDRIEFAVRLVSGALYGAFISGLMVFRVFTYSDHFPWRICLVVVTLAATASAYCSARYGDGYWLFLFKKW